MDLRGFGFGRWLTGSSINELLFLPKMVLHFDCIVWLNIVTCRNALPKSSFQSCTCTLCIVGIELCIGVWKHDYTKINYSFLLGDGSKRIWIWQMTHRCFLLRWGFTLTALYGHSTLQKWKCWYFSKHLS